MKVDNKVEEEIMDRGEMKGNDTHKDGERIKDGII